MPQRDVVLHARTPQIKVAVLQPGVLGHRRLIGDRERRGLGVVQLPDLARADLDRAGADLRVHRLRRARLDTPENRNHILRAQPLRQADERLVVAHDNLRDAMAVTDIDEDKGAEVTNAMHPAEEDDFLTDMGGGQGTTGMGSRQGS